MINEELSGKDADVSHFSGTSPAVAWSDRGKPRKTRSEDSHLRPRYKLGSPEYEAAVLKFAPSTCISSHDIEFLSFSQFGQICPVCHSTKHNNFWNSLCCRIQQEFHFEVTSCNIRNMLIS